LSRARTPARARGRFLTLARLRIGHAARAARAGDRHAPRLAGRGPSLSRARHLRADPGPLAAGGGGGVPPRSRDLDISGVARAILRPLPEPPRSGGSRAHADPRMDVPGRPAGSEGVNVPPAVLVVVGYVLGSISFAVLLVRATTGTDIRAEGSGNAGATNVLRAHGKKLALLVALADVAKGVAAVLLMRLVTADPRWAAAAGFAAILGPVFPV